MSSADTGTQNLGLWGQVFNYAVKIGAQLSAGGDWMLGQSQWREAGRFTRRVSADVARRHGGSPADLPPPPAPSPGVWYAAIPVFGKMGQPSRRMANIGKAVWEWEQEQALKRYLKASKVRLKTKRAAKTLRRVLPKVAAPILKRIPKGTGPLVAAQIAYQVGFEIGTQIYSAYERYAYGPARPKRPAPGAPGNPRGAPGQTQRPPVPRLTQPGGTKIHPIPHPRPAPAPRAAAPARPVPAAPPSAVPATTAATAPAPAVITAPPPAPARSKLMLPRLYRAAQAGLTLAALTGSTSRQKPSSQSRTVPRPLTQSNAPPVRYPPRTRTDQCECEPKKRKAGNRCRNPVVNRTKRTRGGQKYITITRRVECS